KPTHLTPTVDAIEPPNPSLELIRFTGSDRLREHRDDLREIVGMDRSIRPPLPHGLQRLSTVLDQLVIDDIDLAIGRENGDETGNRIDDDARLAFAQRLGRISRLVHVTPLFRGSTKAANSMSRVSSCCTAPLHVRPVAVCRLRVTHRPTPVEGGHYLNHLSTD